MLHFEWDPVKAKTNQRKHGVSFEDAIRVFDDPHALTEPDRIDESGELRWRIIGTFEGFTYFMVVHTVRERDLDEIVRIISARPATQKERNLYEQARAENSR